MSVYEPGEPYEFYSRAASGSGRKVLKYRCFRCKGAPEVYVADRNTHNNYHNRHEWYYCNHDDCHGHNKRNGITVSCPK